MGLLVVIVSGLALSAAPIDYRVYGTTSFQHMGGRDWRFDTVGTYSDAPVGTLVDPSGVGEQTSIRNEVWVSGAEQNLYCESPATGSNVCLYARVGETLVAVNGGYKHPTDLSPGTEFCAHTNTTYVGVTGASFLYSSYNCDQTPTGTGGGGSGGGEEDPPIVIGECNGDPECGASPIILPLTSAQNFKLTSAKNGVLFDLNVDGVPEQTAWTAADARIAFLAIDRDGDGQITSGRELFGDKTLPGQAHGFVALRILNDQMRVEQHLPAQADGVIDAQDPIYAKLLLWEDRNHNGSSEPDELRPLSDLYSGIGLGASVHMRKDGSGNTFRYRGWAYYRTEPGLNKIKDGHEERARRRVIYDVIFVRQ
jgi:hypothetical protein